MSGQQDPCGEFLAHLPLFVGGDLEGEPLEAVGQHAASCGACAGELERARRVRALLLALNAASSAPQVDLWPDLRARLQAEGLTGRRAAAAAARHDGARRWRYVAAAAAVMALGFFLQRQDLLQRSGAPAAPGSGGEMASDVSESPAPTNLAATDSGTTDHQEQQPRRELAGGAPVVPVQNGLRRVPPEELRLGELALPYDGIESELSRTRLMQPGRPSLASGLR